ncbi:MAG: OprO/OprP family phosphate-selective porin [Dysgonamonadaceae bacterium]|jgi:hypothetical protein|nr:OprO/OprP family phosphate-selective porin [Dysgonamonadaceae bacterium]
MKKYVFFTAAMILAGLNVSAQKEEQKFKKAFQSEHFILSGYGQAVANFSEPNSSFDVARIILFATGRLGEKQQFGYMAMIDAGPNTAMQEMYGEYLPSDEVNIRFGQFKIPFTIENPMSASRFETVYPSRSVSAMAGSAGDFNQFDGRGVKAGRDAGVMLSGKMFHIIEYYAGLFNGTGLNTKDRDSHKDFIGTVYLQPLKGLKIGGSIYDGKISMLEDNGSILPSGNYSRRAWAAGGVYDGKHCYFRSEYVAAKTGNINRHGYYASCVWKAAPSKWELVAKYDFFNNSMNETGDVTLGVNYYMAYLTKIQMNYIYTDDKLSGNSHAVAAQLQLFF